MSLYNFISPAKRIQAACPALFVRQNGMALLTTLLILVMLTLLAVSMFRGYGLQQKIAGNIREKERAFQAAQSGLQFSESWLSGSVSQISRTKSEGQNGDACTATANVNHGDAMRICQSTLSNPANPANWIGHLVYTPVSLKVGSGGGTVTDGNANLDINYAAAPQMYVSYIGKSADGKDTLYSVTASGYGGSQNSVTVVQSIIAIRPKVSGKSTEVENE